MGLPTANEELVGDEAVVVIEAVLPTDAPPDETEELLALPLVLGVDNALLLGALEEAIVTTLLYGAAVAVRERAVLNSQVKAELNGGVVRLPGRFEIGLEPLAGRSSAVKKGLPVAPGTE